ncbi:MAG TPA: hypothetical protein VJB59_10110 [Bdellovibrionota bacterium]|nr:hypothetical protein [Bdellovibrionota bacterium]
MNWKTMSLLVLVLAAVGGSGGNQIRAEDCIGVNGIVSQRVGGCYEWPKGGGGEVPVPFGLNERAELADGESYLLVGKVIVYSRKAGPNQVRVYFEVDLRQHPWLANAKRRLNPLYPLEGSASDWKDYDGHTVKLACRAHSRIFRVNDELQHVITLEGRQPL